jgi:hypothetical protein
LANESRKVIIPSEEKPSVWGLLSGRVVDFVTVGHLHAYKRVSAKISIGNCSLAEVFITMVFNFNNLTTCLSERTVYFTRNKIII